MSQQKQKQVDTYYLAVCPECNRYLEYTIDAKVDYLYNIEAEDIDSKMKQAAIATAAEHNSNIQKHSARLVVYKFVEDNHEAENESLRKEKVAVLRGILSL